jgi:hypothetical protein
VFLLYIVTLLLSRAARDAAEEKEDRGLPGQGQVADLRRGTPNNELTHYFPDLFKRNRPLLQLLERKSIPRKVELLDAMVEVRPFQCAPRAHHF